MKKGVPNIIISPGNTAGYFLYETNKGFKFKSIDSLMGQEKKVYLNETPDSRGADIPEKDMMEKFLVQSVLDKCSIKI